MPVDRLVGSLQIDASPRTCEVLGWTPPVSVHDGLTETARWYLEHR
jgi:nucleoside-diphosphate-sugar epimerase